MEKVKYKCKSCNWTKEMPADWADIKPKFCPTPTCQFSLLKNKGRKSFRTHPDILETSFFNSVEEAKPTEESIEIITKEEKTNGQAKASIPNSRQTGKSNSKEISD